MLRYKLVVYQSGRQTDKIRLFTEGSGRNARELVHKATTTIWEGREQGTRQVKLIRVEK